MANDTFQKFKSSINKGVTTISVKTSSSLEKAKIKTQIDSLETEVQRMKTVIGDLAYAKWENGDSDFSSLNDQFAAVWQKKEEILRLTQELNAIDERDNQILANMNAAPVPPVSQTGYPGQMPQTGYPGQMPQTGYTAPISPTVQETVPGADASACPSCGMQYQPGAKFCRQCGTKLQ